MPGQAVETQQKITAPARLKIFCSDYPKSDGVQPESTQKSSGSIKTSITLSILEDLNTILNTIPNQNSVGDQNVT